MLYCIKIERGGIVEEDVVLHHEFDKKPTREDILKLIESEDMGYDDKYCDFEYYQVD